MIFTDAEIAYLDSQPIGRLATVAPDGPQVNPVGYRWNPDTRTIDIGGFEMARSRKFRNVARTGRAALVVDDIVSTSPWQVRYLEVRGDAETVADPGGEPVPPGADAPAIIRLHPRRVLAYAVEDPANAARNVRDVAV